MDMNLLYLDVFLYFPIYNISLATLLIIQCMLIKSCSRNAPLNKLLQSFLGAVLLSLLKILLGSLKSSDRKRHEVISLI